MDSARVIQISATPAATAETMAFTDADRVGFTGLNDQQWKTLVQMLNERSCGSHDHITHKLIGVGEQLKGLYFF
ncbi:unnamed protein product [Brassica oleracea]